MFSYITTTLTVTFRQNPVQRSRLYSFFLRMEALVLNDLKNFIFSAKLKVFRFFFHWDGKVCATDTFVFVLNV